MIVQTDLDINRAVRRILVKHWIDLGRIAVRTVQGRVVLFGELRRIEGHRETLSGANVEAIFCEIRRIRGLESARAHFDNWTNDGGRWRPCQRGQNASSGADAPNADGATDSAG